MMFITRKCRTLLVSVLVVGAVFWLGCGGSITLIDPKECGSGTFTDSRDDKTYKTVTIGGKTWMAQNLNYQTGNSVCYGGDDSNCEKYGRLYDWMGSNKVCPNGWHLPSRDEWVELATMVGFKKSGKKLKSTSGWDENGNGTDDYGFSALSGGFGTFKPVAGTAPESIFDGVGKYGRWRMAVKGEAIALGAANIWGIDYNRDYSSEFKDLAYQTRRLSVRCVQD